MNDPIALWLQSQSCTEEQGMLRTQWAPIVELYFQPVEGGWAAYVGSSEVKGRMRIGTCRELAQVQQIYRTILELNAQPVRVRVG